MKMTMQGLGKFKEVEISVTEYKEKDYFREPINLGKLNKTKVDGKINKLKRINETQDKEILKLVEHIRELISDRSKNNRDNSKNINEFKRVMGKRKNILRHNIQALNRLMECVENNYTLATDDQEMHLLFIKMLENCEKDILVFRPLTYENMNKKLYPIGAEIRSIFNLLEADFPKVREREIELYCALKGETRGETSIRDWVYSSHYNEKMVLRALKEYFGEDSNYESILIYSHNIYKEVTEFIAGTIELTNIGYKGNRLTCISSSGKEVSKLARYTDVRCDIEGHGLDITILLEWEEID